MLPADVSLLLLEAVAKSAQVSSILDRLDYLPSYIGSVKSKKKISTLKRRYGTKSRGEVPTKAKTEIFIEAAQLRHYQFKPTDDLI